MADNATVRSSAEFLADPARFFEEVVREHRILNFSDVPYSLVPTGAVTQAYSDDAEDFDMVALRTKFTGVDNTIFVSPKGHARHAARIKIAIDPPQKLSASGATAIMAIHDCGIVSPTASVPPLIVRQAAQFIERNRDVLMDFWSENIAVEELLARLKPAQ
jgi:hypothetical protein